LLPVSLTRVNSMSDGTSAARQVRISDADRERAAQRLQQALVEGRITLNEMDERMAEVYAARFAGDLEGPFADLPEGALVPSVIRLSPASSGQGADVVVLRTASGSLKRRGRWLLPERLAVEVGSGSVTLDCTEALIACSPVTIAVTVRSGSIKILVPEGLTADIDRVQTKNGSARSKVASVPTGSHPHLVLTGTVGSGSVVVRRPYFS